MASHENAKKESLSVYIYRINIQEHDKNTKNMDHSKINGLTFYIFSDKLKLM